MKPLNKGDTIYVPKVQWTQLPKKCPVCNGTTRILVKALGALDETGTEMSCEYCRWAERDGLQRGHVVEEWCYKAHIQVIVIEGLEINDRPGKKEVKYLYNCTSCSWNSVSHEEVYTSREEAERVAASDLSKAHEKQHNKDLPNPSHSVGYYKKEIKGMKERLKAWENCLQNNP